MLTLNDGRSELWQWDTGRTLAVDADCSQVHFSNKVFGRSIDVDVVDGVAVIPDILLQTDNDLNVWAFVGTAENGYTKVSKTFKVNRRNKPADYVFTPTDQMTLQAIQRQIGDLADLTTEAKDTLVAAINEAARTGGGAGSIEFRVADGYVQYSTDGGSTWTNLIAMADLKGDPGAPGKDGAPGIYYGTTPPTGDTHPVWIDPDGDHDDGGLLPAVTAADNGKVLRVVSSAWSAEDMPTGGTDMGITGAAVGQIAKITSVDASGAPTAWAAVDMPEKLPNPNALTFTGAVTGSYDGSAPLSVDIPSVGGGSGGGITGFRRVVDTTLTEDAEIVNLTTDINGNTFSLSECYLFIEAACTEPSSITYIPNGYWATNTYMVSGSKTATDYPYIYIAYGCGGPDHFFGFELKHRTGVSMTNYISNWSAYLKPITSYKLSGKFSKGARFIIFGRDA